MASFKNLTLLKVLATIAWADGEITESEKNILKRFYRKFDLTKKEMGGLKPYVAAPVPKEEQNRLFKQLAAELGSQKERDRVVAVLEEMANADKKLKIEERKLVEEFARQLKKSNVTKRAVGKIRNFFQANLFKPEHEKNPELHKYFKNTVLHSIELNNDGRVNKLRLPEDQVYFICLFGTLLASVAHVDDHFHDEEKKSLKRVLKERFSFTGKELELLMDVIEGQARRGFDFHEVTREFNHLYSYNDRVGTVDCFFAVAAADGEISYEESEEIRRITKALRIPHQVFKESKVRALERLRSAG